MTLPGGNVFLTDRDRSTADGFIQCHQISPGRALYDAFKALRYLARLAVEVPK